MSEHENVIEHEVPQEAVERTDVAEKEPILVQQSPNGGIYLGSLWFPDYKSMMEAAAKIAESVAYTIDEQHLYQDLVFKDKNSGGHKTSRHIKLEGWQVLMAHLGLTIMEEGVVEVVSPSRNGFEAAASLIRQDGLKIARMSAYCGFEEGWWTDKAPYALRSMAITRACAKVITATYRWIMKMRGYEGTPLEEMGEYYTQNERPKAEASVGRVPEPQEMSVKQVADSLAEYGLAKYKWERAITLDHIRNSLGRNPDSTLANRRTLPALKIALDLAYEKSRSATLEEINQRCQNENVDVRFEIPTK